MQISIDCGYFFIWDSWSRNIELDNGDVLKNKGNCDAFMVKYSSNGDIEWGKGFGGSSREFVSCAW